MLTSLPIKLMIRSAGYCVHPEWLTLKGGSFRPVKFPAGFACLLHPVHGTILFDTGYSTRFFRETATLPNALYRYITPVHFQEEDSAAAQLRQEGIAPENVRYIILSHFHADHIGGARDYPNAHFIYLDKAYTAVRGLGKFARVKAGFLPGLLPEDFADRSLPVGEAPGRRGLELDSSAAKPSATWATSFGPGAPFSPEEVYDLLGDGSVLAVELSGHAEGMIGVFVSTTAHDYLLCADTVWSSRAFLEQRPPHPAAGLIMSDRLDYKHSFKRLQALRAWHPGLRVVPSHCPIALDNWGKGVLA